MGMKRRRIFFDMDGTIAAWQSAKSYEDLLSRGYFLALPPMENMVKAAKLIARDTERYDPYILSAVLGESCFALEEKNVWLDKHLPEIEKAHRVFTRCGVDKASSVPGGIRSNDVLIDDYSFNLRPWSMKAIGIKVLNGINGTVGTWMSQNGICVKADWPPEKIKETIDNSIIWS